MRSVDDGGEYRTPRQRTRSKHGKHHGNMAGRRQFVRKIIRGNARLMRMLESKKSVMTRNGMPWGVEFSNGKGNKRTLYEGVWPVWVLN